MGRLVTWSAHQQRAAGSEGDFTDISALSILVWDGQVGPNQGPHLPAWLRGIGELPVGFAGNINAMRFKAAPI